MKDKIQLKRIDGSVFFEYEDEDNSVKKTLEVYIKRERAKGKENVDLSYANLSFTNLIGADLRNANLSNADLSFTDLRCDDLSYANLKGADLRFTDLSYVDLSNASLINTNLEEADLRGADLKDAKLSGANFSDTILNSVKNIKYASCCFMGNGNKGGQLIGVKINNETMLFCGCFKGNEAELRKYIEEDEEKYKASRLIALDTVLKLINVEKS